MLCATTHRTFYSKKRQVMQCAYSILREEAPVWVKRTQNGSEYEENEQRLPARRSNML